MQPEAVIFDIGNVLIEWQPERFYDRVIGADRRRAMFAEVDLHGMNEKVDQMKQKYQETKEALAQGIKQKYQQKKEALAQAWGNLKEKLTKK